MTVVRPVVRPSVVRSVVRSVLGDDGPVPIFHMPLSNSLLVSKGIGPATFTAASTRTYIDPDDGLLKIAAINDARFESEGCLIWGAAENLFTRSEEIDHADWTKTNLTVTANNATAPDGNTAMDLMIPSASSVAHYFNQDKSVTSGTDYVTSVFADSGGYDFIQITGSTGFASEWVNFNLSTGAVGDSSLSTGTAKIEDMGGGIYRCSLSLPAISTVTGRMLVAVYNTDTASRLAAFTGDGTSGVNGWGAQFEEGTSPSPYIPTVATAVTALSDNLSVDSDNIPDPGDDWSASFEFDVSNTGVGTPFLFNPSGETFRRCYILSGNMNWWVGNNIATAISAATNYKNALTKNATTTQVYLDGVAQGSSTPGTTTGTRTRIDIGRDSSTADRYLNGHIKNIKVFDKTLTAAEVAKL